MSSPQPTLRERVQTLCDLNAAIALLEWDQRVTMPAGAAPARARQLATLSAVRHERLTDPALGALLAEARPADAQEARSLALIRREVDRATRVPAALVSALAQAQGEAYAAWMQARQDEDFAAFAPHLGRVLALTREVAEARRQGQAELYDVLLDEYDPGSTTAALEPMFTRLGEGLGGLLRALAERPAPEPLRWSMPAAAQRALHQELITTLGYDLAHGRLDETQHPFTTAIGPLDTRQTTHLYEDQPLNGLYGTLHETGHALYEQGLPRAWEGTLLNTAASYGLHESQSRFWENTIGRSRAFCRYLASVLPRYTRGHPGPGELYAAANAVRPSLIRVFADEVTYNLHIVLRFGLELELVNGRLPVAELPAAWDEASARLLGVRAQRPSEGVLQDVHWSAGLFGYFPSYTLGNLYAASLRAGLEQALPALWDHVEVGDFAPILAWLRAHVHQHGALHEAPEVLRAAVGERDAVADLLQHLRERTLGG